VPLRPKYAPRLWLRLRWRLSPTRVVYERYLRTYLVLAGLAALRRRVGRRPERIAVDQLSPGQGILVRTIPVTSAKQRKRLLRGET
jgi:hypothetical protein